MLIRDAVTQGATQLNDDRPQQTARRLLAHVLGKQPVYVIAHDDEQLDEAQSAAYKHLIGRASAGEPLPYLLGHAPFRQYDFVVSPAVLIPRPETEQLVDMAADWVRARPLAHTIIDVGTGSGCIAVSLALELDMAVEAVDFSAAALAVAEQNAANYEAAVTFYHGSLLTPLAARGAHTITCLVANLPYITDAEWTTLHSAVKLYEPSMALRGGREGLDLIDELLRQAQTALHPDGAIFLEIGWKQGADTITLAKRYFPQATIDCHRDDAGHDRIVSIQQNLR